ncbi:MAG TPA: cupin domain-containing protein [Candidatus Binataceae bacterium]
MAATDIASVEEAWRARGFGCDLWTDPPRKVWKDFTHNVEELLVVVEDELEVEIGGVARRRAPGDEVFIAARALHTVRNLGGATARWLYGYRER